MYFKKKKFCIAILASTLTLSLIGINHSQLVNAAEATSITYPFRTGEGALINSPTVKAPTEQASGDNWLWYEQQYDIIPDLSNATYVAVEFLPSRAVYELVQRKCQSFGLCQAVVAVACGGVGVYTD